MIESDSNENQKKALKWLKEKWPEESQICPVCAEKKFSLPKHVVMFKTFPISLKVYPNFLILCQNCGHTYFFNAVIAEIVEKDKQQENQEENPPIEQKEKAKESFLQKLKRFFR